MRLELALTWAVCLLLLFPCNPNTKTGLSKEKLKYYYFGSEFWALLCGRFICLSWWALIYLKRRRGHAETEEPDSATMGSRLLPAIGPSASSSLRSKVSVYWEARRWKLIHRHKSLSLSVQQLISPTATSAPSSKSIIQQLEPGKLQNFRPLSSCALFIDIDILDWQKVIYFRLPRLYINTIQQQPVSWL